MSSPKRAAALAMVFCFSFRFKPERHTEAQLWSAVTAEFQNVANGLGVDTMDAPGFLDYIGDRMSDADVPADMLERIRERCCANS